MSVVASITDFVLYKIALKFWGTYVAQWTLLVSFFSHFNFIYSTRASSNSMETCLCVLAYYLWPWKNAGKSFLFYSKLLLSFFLIGIGTLIRPTLSFIWFIPFFQLVYKKRDFWIVGFSFISV